jgi:hypothetical protein
VNIEIAEDATYIFSFTKTDFGAVPGDITTATLRILGPDGAEYKASTAMTIADPSATLSVNFASDPTGKTYSRARNYTVEYTIDGSVYKEFFDIVRTPFANRVVDQDLIDENHYLLDGQAEQTGIATSGNTVTLVDTARNEPDDYWNGGKIFIYPLVDTGNVVERLITDWVKSTGTFTFTPAVTSITTEGYSVRRSYKTLTDNAANRVREDIGAQGHPAYLLIDFTSMKRLTVLKALEMYFQQMRSAKDDKYDLQFEHYKEEYLRQFNAIPLQMDIDDDGTISEEEAKGSSFMSVSMRR